MAGGAGDGTLQVEAITIYPVKGLHGLSVEAAEVEPWGLAGDRRWMVVNAEGRFLSQRELPAMALIEAQPVPEGLVLSAPGHARRDVPLPCDAAGPPAMVTLWKSTVLAVAAAPAAQVWLSAVLDHPCRLVYMPNPAHARAVDPAYGGEGDRVSFADGFPLLAATTASLEALNDRLARPVPMDRFRANVVIAGGSAFMEDGWRQIRIGPAAFKAVKSCARCAVPTVDQATGRKAEDNEPLRTLGTFRRDATGQILFGQNLIPSAVGRIAVGDLIEILPGA